MRVLVTGGAGFIGSNLARALVLRGDEVHVLDDLSSGRRSNVPHGAMLHQADVRFPEGVVQGVQPECVLHLAAQADVRVSVRNPVADADVNVLGTVAVLEAARKVGARVVFASTGGAIYGECSTPAVEGDACSPVAPYGAAKLAAEGYLGVWGRLYGLSHVSLRFSNVYGPGQDPLGEAGVVAIFMGCVLRGEQAVVFGDGSQMRDYTFVGDVVAAVVSAIRETPSSLYNVGTGFYTSVVGLHAQINALTGSTLPPIFREARLGELQNAGVNPGRALRELPGWQKPRPLYEGLQATWEHLQQEAHHGS